MSGRRSVEGPSVKLKNLIRYPVDLARARRILAARPDAAASRPSRPFTLDLYTPDLLFDCGRHLASMAHHAGSIGSMLYLRCSRTMLAAIAHKPHGARMLAMPHVVWLPTSARLPANTLVLRDVPSAQADRPSRGEQSLTMLIGRDLLDNCPVMPYPMHPLTLSHLDAETVLECRQSPGRRGIFFAGNQKSKYGDEKMTTQFGVISRLEILQNLRSNFADRITPEPIGQQRLPIVLRDSNQDPIAPVDWLATLARFQFFVCCPGAAQPVCHNLVEAMSVGTIPLIEYGDRLRPGLRDGVNAICFHGPTGLVEAIKRIDRLSDAQVRELSTGAADYFDCHLCGDRFFKSLRDGAIGTEQTRICMPFHSQNLYASWPSRAA